MKEFLLYGRKPNEPAYMEDLLAERIYTPDEMIKAQKQAKLNGYENLRVASFDGGAPDFVNAINILTKKLKP